MFTLQHFSYCGMAGIPRRYSDRYDARREAADMLRRYRRRFKVQTLKRGQEWEVLEPENAVMVPDACGTISLEYSGHVCPECGGIYDDADDASRCCSVWEFINDEE